MDGKAEDSSDRQTRPARPVGILYVENGIGYGGAAICLRHLVRNLDRSLYVPLVVTGRGGRLYQGISEDADWRHIQDRHLETMAMKVRLDDTDWIRKVPGLSFLLNQVIARADDLLNFLPFFLRLWRLARKVRPALVHANNEPMCNRATLFVGKLIGVPVVCHVRGDPNIDTGWFVRWLYSLPDHFLPVSRWVSAEIGRLGVEEERRTVVYDGIAIENMDLAADGKAFRKAQSIEEGEFAVGLVGMLVPWKGQELFIDTALILNDRIPGLRMLMIGGTPDDCRDYERALRERVAAEGLRDLMRFTGHVDDMASVYNGLDVVLSASTSPEPLGTVVIESMTMQRPLLVPDHGGGAEMVEDGVTGLVFRAGDPSSLAEKIVTLYRDRELGRRLGAAARTKALETFAVESHVRVVESVYDELLKKR